MFKKTLVAVAALAAFGTVSAANFTLYGTVDESLVYDYSKTKVAGQEIEKSHSLGLASGYNSASKFGFKGTEDLGNGLKVGFRLENQFSADDGQLTDGLLFRREASLSVYSDYGTLSMGRMGGVGSSAGTYDLVYLYADAFDGGDNAIFGVASSARYDNMVTYQSPKFAGVQATVQYSFKTKGAESAQSSKNRQYAGAGVTGDFGPLGVVAAYEYNNYTADDGIAQDGHAAYFGGNYDCGFAKTFALVQYFKGWDSAAEVSASDVNEAFVKEIKKVMGAEWKGSVFSDGLKGYGLHLGSIVPVAGGDLTVGVYYVDAKLENIRASQDFAVSVDGDVKYLGASARYVYPLSKRTSVYGGAGLAQAKLDKVSVLGVSIDPETKTTVGQAYFGLTHQF
ncbi:MAG: porin [Sutterella sp.]|nr:porin [Sutterella sp.]